MTNISSGDVGIADYTLKRDFRRVLDKEVRAEGHVKFQPNPTISATSQYTPPGAAGAITIIAEARLASGKHAVIVGTATTLWQYFGLENGAYYALLSDSTYVTAVDYFNDNPGEWIIIGDGFSQQSRWEAENVGDYLILNNGVDLPVTFRFGESSVTPIWELREAGIASVGTIAEHRGILICCDIRQLTTNKHTEIMTPIAASVNAAVVGVQSSLTARAVINSGVAGVAGLVMTATDASFNSGAGFVGMAGVTIRMANGTSRTIAASPAPTATICTVSGNPTVVEPNQPFSILGANDKRVTPNIATLFPSNAPANPIGLKLFWESGEVAEIKSISGGYYVVDSDRPIPSGPVSIENPLAYARFEDASYIQRYHNRMIWSMPGKPRRFAAIVPCVVDPTSNTVELKYPVRSLSTGMSVLIVGAGFGGGNLTAEILLAMPKAISVRERAITESAILITQAITEAVALVSQRLAEKTGASSTNSIASQALESAKVASAALPNDADLKKAEADASAAFDAAAMAYTTASDAYDAAIKARDVAIEAIQPTDTELVAADAEASIAGLFEDLEGDGSAIIKAKTIKGFLAVYKESGSIFLARYTGNVLFPFQFDEIKIPHDAALPDAMRDTLVSINDNYHLYAGADEFWQFDISNRMPRIIEPLRLVKNLFLSQPAQSRAEVVGVVTQEEVGSEIFITTTWSGLESGSVYTLSFNGLLSEVTPSGTTHSFTYYVSIDSETAPPEVVVKLFSAYVVKKHPFACINAATREVWFCNQSETSSDGAVCFDYANGTVRTSSARITSGATITSPEDGLWFVIGDSESKLFRYGLLLVGNVESGVVTATKTSASQVVTASGSTFSPSHIGRTIKFASGKMFAISGFTSPTSVTVVGAGSVLVGETFSIIPAVWHRDGASYDSVLESGLSNFGSSHHDKMLNEYVLIPSSTSADSPVAVMFRAGASPRSVADVQGATITSPQTMGLLKPTVLNYFIGDRLTVSGINNPFELAERLFGVVPRNSKSFGRRGNGL